MVQEVQTVWRKTFDSPFSLKRDEFYKLLRQCPSVQEGLEDVDESAADSWAVLHEPRVPTMCVHAADMLARWQQVVT